MRYSKFTDRAKEWLTTHKVLLLQIVAVAGIVAVVAAVIIPSIASRGKSYDEALERVEQSMSNMSAQLAGLSNTVTRVSANLENAITDFTDVMRDTQGEVQGIGGAASQFITMLEQLQDDLARISDGPPTAWLTGTFGDYTLHTRSNEGGNFTANIYLRYDAPVALNATSYSEAMDEFYADVDWDDEDVRAYVPILIHNGTAWFVTAIHFNVGTFVLEAGVVREVAVVYGGLEGYEPDWAYVEIYPVLKKS